MDQTIFSPDSNPTSRSFVEKIKISAYDFTPVFAINQLTIHA